MGSARQDNAIVHITDLRDVPLDQLSTDVAASDLVNTVMRGMEGPSRVSVAGFSSGI